MNSFLSDIVESCQCVCLLKVIEFQVYCVREAQNNYYSILEQSYMGF
jgi:hypothetical protein